jgi:hypothetical protein
MTRRTRYAQGTSTSVEDSRREIEKVLQRYNASGFGYSWERREMPIVPTPVHGAKTEMVEFATVAFQFKERRIRLDVPMPTQRELGAKRNVEQATRERWRAMVLVIRAKLEAVASGISTLEQEFLANVVTQDGRTVGEILVPRLSEATKAGRLLPPAQEG